MKVPNRVLEICHRLATQLEHVTNFEDREIVRKWAEEGMTKRKEMAAEYKHATGKEMGP